MATGSDHDLEIDNDVRQQENEWVIQRIAWVLLTALLIAVVFGLFGRGGPISEVNVSSEDGAMRLEYDRFVRYHSPDTLQVRINNASGNVRLKLDSQYASRIQIERITPQPEQEISAGDRTNTAPPMAPVNKLPVMTTMF